MDLCKRVDVSLLTARVDTHKKVSTHKVFEILNRRNMSASHKHYGVVDYNEVHLLKLKYKFEVLVLYLSISILCHFLFLLQYTLEANIVLFTALHLFDKLVTSYFADLDGPLCIITAFTIDTLSIF